MHDNYRISASWLEIAHHIGARYCRLQTGDYEVKSDGALLERESMSRNSWTFPLGIAFSHELEVRGGWFHKIISAYADEPYHQFRITEP